MEKTVVALFDNLDTAQSAVQALLDSGFSRDDISVVRTNQQDDYTSGDITEKKQDDTSGAAAGAGIGAVLGGLAGLLVGLGTLAIPGIGPIVAAGPLATALAGAGLGAATGGLVGALADSGIPEREAGAYAEGVRRGGTLVTVQPDEGQVDRATDILNRFTPVDVDQRAGEWKSSGWTGYDANAGPYSASTGAPHTQQANDMPKGTYQAGMGMTGENSGGTYEGSGSAGYTGPGTTYRGSGSFTSNTESSATHDSPGSTTRAYEESVMSSGHGEMSTSQGFSGQGQNLVPSQGRDLEKSYDRTMGDMSRGFEAYDRDFRSDWENSFRTSGYGYERYQPAYQYGYNLGTDTRYRGGDWSEIEPHARRDWEQRRPNDAWDDFKDAIQHAWVRVRSEVRDTLD